MTTMKKLKWKATFWEAGRFYIAYDLKINAYRIFYEGRPTDYGFPTLKEAKLYAEKLFNQK